ncbi:MAG: GNAT family N-acetyltransferase [Pseudomonadales bacterium]|nr:GNAT family N-acetyltransferase [Pseudomonadales bacterium]
MKIEWLDSISSVSESEWQACLNSDYPFLKYGFLSALEASGCVQPETGWVPQHLIAQDSGRVVAVMPQYFKSHSWGEYVFDQEWANAYHRYGIRYYPKLINAMPFTPATGPRWSLRLDAEESIVSSLIAASLEQVDSEKTSTWHCLFPDLDKQLEQLFDEKGVMKRVGTQFHWFNRGYCDFDEFLSVFASRKRKNVRKERKAVHDLGLSCVRKSGTEMSESDWIRFYEFYASTYYKRGHSPHLNLEFFKLVAARMGQSIMVDWVFDQGGKDPIAAALFFKDSETLYGRYWGCKSEIQGLHFEVCFYRGIEYAIAHGLKKFDPGAQGEHKIARGFEPIETCSFHYVGHPGFRDAIANFLEEEARYVNQYKLAAAERLPFKLSENA